ncbi:MAG: restriction endonuclease [Mongoliitalea sp.]
MRIGKYLKAGKININWIEERIEIANEQLILPFDKLKESYWGLVYEKYVGQILEQEGYIVHYPGLEKGFLDGGIDLIATKENQLYFIQCKYTKAKITKSRIDWILYKSSKALLEKYKEQNKKLFFMLVVNSKDENFSKKKMKNYELKSTDSSKIIYPTLQYFLDYNNVQNKITLVFREIAMIKP